VRRRTELRIPAILGYVAESFPKLVAGVGKIRWPSGEGREPNDQGVGSDQIQRILGSGNRVRHHSQTVYYGIGNRLGLRPNQSSIGINLVFLLGVLPGRIHLVHTQNRPGYKVLDLIQIGHQESNILGLCWWL